jgi:hypothetical protein
VHLPRIPRKWDKRCSDWTYVKGIFGTLKNRNTGFIQAVKIEMATFWYGMAADSFNI